MDESRPMNYFTGLMNMRMRMHVQRSNQGRGANVAMCNVRIDCVIVRVGAASQTLAIIV